MYVKTSVIPSFCLIGALNLQVIIKLLDSTRQVLTVNNLTAAIKKKIGNLV